MIKSKNFGAVALLLLLSVVGGFFWLGGYLHKPFVITQAQVVEVFRGGNLSALMTELERRGALGAGVEVRLRRLSVRGYNFFTGVSQRLHIGEYRLVPGESMLSLLEKLERGEVMQRSFTLVEGWDIRELRNALQHASGVVSTLVGIDDSVLMEQLGLPGMHPEGWFAADTYFYTAGEKDIDLLARALTRQQQLLEEMWSKRDAGLPYADPYDALIMASIVEKETGAPQEREQIAGVFVERLQRGMRLQTDPTVIYGMGEQYQGNIRRQDLQAPTPYNTYVIRGLPPTPIAMPGADAIYAALHPAQTEALYFVARGDGTHQFSSTLEEHQQAVREYQLRRRENYRSAPLTESP